MVDSVYTDLASAYTAFLNAATGDRIMMANGSYDISPKKNLTKNAAGVVTFMSENRGGATLTGDGMDLGSNDIVFEGFDVQMDGIINSQYMDINGDRCRLTRNKWHCQQPGSSNKWVRVRADDVIVDRNEFYNKSEDDVCLLVFRTGVETTGCKILYNYFHDMNGANTECLRVGDSNICTHNFFCEIAYNRFENIDADPEIISCKGSEVDIHNNYLLNSDSAITLRQCYDVRVDSNYLDNVGIRLYGRGHEITRNKIFNTSTTTQGRQAMVLGNADVVNYPVDTTNANYAHTQLNLIDSNYIDARNATTLIIFDVGFTSEGHTITPSGNTITNNTVKASTGKLTGQINGALFSDNTCTGNVLVATGTATVGDMAGQTTTDNNPCSRLKTVRHVRPIPIAYVGVNAP